MSVDVQIPSSRQVPLSVNEGRPMVFSRPRSTVSRRIGELAERLTSATPASSTIEPEPESAQEGDEA
jgi:MinD-like ATPase involved in chromosome partitioning or flagellar assembly